MKFSIFKVLVLLSLVISFTNALNIINELKDKKKDIETYLKVKDIKRWIPFNEKQRTLDVYYRKNEMDTLKPVVIYIHGGTWYFGDRIKFTKLGILVEENGYIGVIPNYVLFPYGDMNDMVYDVYSSIKWTYENIEKYGGDPTKITVVGHSAGAHLIALTLLKAYTFTDYKGKTLEPLPTLDKILLLAGPYDFDDFTIFKNDAKEDDENADDTAVEKLVEFFLRIKNASPYDIVKEMDDNSVDDKFNVNKFIFYYTNNDTSVPEKSAKKFMRELKRVSKDIEIQYVYNEDGYTHTSITTGIRKDDQVQIDIFLSLLEL